MSNDPTADGPATPPTDAEVPPADAGDARATTSPRRGRRRSDQFDLARVLTIAVGVGGGLLLAQVTVSVASRLRTILLILLLSLFLSFAMEPAVQWLHNRGIRRGVGTAGVFLAMAGLAGGFITAMSGLVSDQIRSLTDSAPTLIARLSDQATGLPDIIAQPLADFLNDQSVSISERIGSVAGRLGIGIGTTLAGAIFSTLAVALLTFYLVADGPRLRWQLSRRLEPVRQKELLQVWELAIAKTGGYVYSRILLAVVSAGVHIAAFTVADLRYAAALGVWMGLVSSIIPVVGLYIAGALPVIVAIANPDTSLITILVVMVVYQQIENYVVQPRITKHTLALHPAVAFVSVLAGGALLGVIGALLALPAAAIVAALVTAYAEEHEVTEHRLTTTREARVATRP